MHYLQNYFLHLWHLNGGAVKFMNPSSQVSIGQILIFGFDIDCRQSYDFLYFFLSAFGSAVNI